MYKFDIQTKNLYNEVILLQLKHIIHEHFTLETLNVFYYNLYTQ